MGNIVGEVAAEKYAEGGSAMIERMNGKNREKKGKAGWKGG